MTREEAIADLKSINATGMECIDYAIAVLEQPTSDDCVSRQAVADAVENTIAKYIPTFIGYYEKIPLELALAIRDVPSVKPTHSTCKDCTNYVVGALDEEICLRGHELIHKDFYCADYEKRGNENV